MLSADYAAFSLEKKYNKDEIFELYVNTIYFGSGYYGIAAAAAGYCDKMWWISATLLTMR